jgi:Alcohol dehydrogenase GroES-like domain
MRAVVFAGTDRVAVEHVADPPAPGPGAVLVRVSLAGICGTDLHVIHGDFPGVSPGMVIGHEFVGRVDAIGTGVHRLAVGDTVMTSDFTACGRCRWCDRRSHGHCEQRAFFGTGLGRPKRRTSRRLTRSCGTYSTARSSIAIRRRGPFKCASTYESHTASLSGRVEGLGEHAADQGWDGADLDRFRRATSSGVRRILEQITGAELVAMRADVIAAIVPNPKDVQAVIQTLLSTAVPAPLTTRWGVSGTTAIPTSWAQRTRKLGGRCTWPDGSATAS